MAEEASSLPLVAVGIDLGTYHARVAIKAKNDSTARVLSNPQGYRATRALVAQEETWNDGNNNNNNNKNTTPDLFVFGDAAIRYNPMSVRDELMKCVAQQQQYEKNTQANQQEHPPTLSAPAIGFLSYLCQMAADASSVSPEQLRVVLTIPNHYDTTTTNEPQEENDDNDNDDDDDDIPNDLQDYSDVCSSVVTAALKRLMGKNKAKKKKIGADCVGLLTEAAAVCVAHGLANPTSTASKKMNILVLNGGASGFQITHLVSYDGLLVQQSHTCQTSVSGPVLVQLLGKHVATQFERQHRLSPGEVWQNSKKARTKLLKEAERTLAGIAQKNHGNSNLVMTVDGLYEGMDCHVVVSKPRWDSLLTPLLRQLQQGLAPYTDRQNGAMMMDRVLTAGAWAKPILDPLVAKLFGRQRMANDTAVVVSPEEVIALGCAQQAALWIDREEGFQQLDSPIVTNVVACPVTIGGSHCQNDNDNKNEEEEEKDDAAATVWIAKGTPLPTRVVIHCPTNNNNNNSSTTIWQLEPQTTKLARVEETYQELVLELSADGELSIAVDGQQPVTVSNQ